MRIQKHVRKHTRRVCLLQGQKDLVERLGGAAWVEQPAAAGAARGAHVHYTAGERSSAKRLRFPAVILLPLTASTVSGEHRSTDPDPLINFISFLSLAAMQLLQQTTGCERAEATAHTTFSCGNTQRSRVAWICKISKLNTKKQQLDTWILDYCMYNGIRISRLLRLSRNLISRT